MDSSARETSRCGLRHEVHARNPQGTKRSRGRAAKRGTVGAQGCWNRGCWPWMGSRALPWHSQGDIPSKCARRGEASPSPWQSTDTLFVLPSGGEFLGIPPFPGPTIPAFTHFGEARLWLPLPGDFLEQEAALGWELRHLPFDPCPELPFQLLHEPSQRIFLHETEGKPTGDVLPIQLC